MPATRDGTSAISSARWAGAGFLGGASLLGMLWATLGRAPAVPPRVIERVSEVTTPPAVSAQPSLPERATSPPEKAVASGEPDAVTVHLESSTESVEPTQPQATQGREEARAATPEPAPTLDATTRINVNTASRAELELLPRIGPTLARRIIELREQDGPIRSLTHLMDVKGIGERTAERLGPYVRFD